MTTILKKQIKKHKWTEEDIRIVYATCRSNPDIKECHIILQRDFPDCSNGSIKFVINRYVKRNNNQLSWSPDKNGIKGGWSTQGKLFDKVWKERDWKQII